MRKSTIGKTSRYYLPRVERTCIICGKVFNVTSSVARKGGGKYCSRKCQHLSLVGRKKEGTRTELKCARCGKIFSVHINRKEKAIYCSRKCHYNTGTKTNRFCEFCGKSFVTSTIRINDKRGKFCSKKCYDISRKGNPENIRKSKELWLDKQYREKQKRGLESASVTGSALERHVYEYISSALSPKGIEVKFKDREMLNGPELDILIPALKIAIEVQGACHFRPIFGSTQFNTVLKSDEKKAKIFNSLDGWKLLYINAPYEITMSQAEAQCDNHIRQLPGFESWKLPDKIAGQYEEIERECEYCKKKFTISLFRVRAGEGRFCSKECFDLMTRRETKEDAIRVICGVCGKEFNASPHTISARRGKYCSKECYYKSKEGKYFGKRTSIEIICQKCGKKFTVNKARASEAKFCSRACRRTDKAERTCQHCGKQFFMPLYKLNRGEGKFCSKQCFNLATKGNIEKMRELSESRGGKCLSKTYVNNLTKLSFSCKEGHVWKAVPGSVKSGKWCPYCAHIVKLTISEMKNIAESRGGKCLSEQYRGNKVKLKWECKEGHVWEATPHDIKSGAWCPYCAPNVKLTIEEMHKIAESRGGMCLSDVYVNSQTKLKWQCKKGHQWKAVPNSVKLGGWCPYCAGHMRLTIEKMQEIAADREGKCLSKEYLNNLTKLQWQCKLGHNWWATFSNISRGKWCPVCANKKKGHLA